jgi:hypothetical protein
MKDTPSKLDQIRSLGSTEIFRRFGAPTERRPVPAVPGVSKGFVGEPPHPPPLDTPVNTPVNTPPVHRESGIDKRKEYRREWMRKKRARKDAGT